MAGNFNISYVFNAKDKFSAVGRKVSNSFSRIGKAAKKIPSQIAKATKSLNPFKRRLKATKKQADGFAGSLKRLAVGFIGFQAIKGAINIGADFQTAMADLNAITGATAETMAFLREESFRLGKSAVVDQAKVATAFKLVASAKSELLEDPKGLSKVTQSVLLLANAAGLDMETATRAAVGALNQFNKGAKDADRFVNVLAASQAFGASEVGALTEALKVSGKIASITGLSFEETNAALQVLAKSNIKGSEAGTGFKNALVQLDIKLGKLGPATVGLSRSLEVIKSKNLTAAEATQLFGAEAATSILTLADGIPTLQRFTRQMTGTSEAQRQAAANLSTFNKKFEKLAITIKAKIIRLFLRLEPTLVAIVSRIGEFFDKITPQQINDFANNVGKLIDKFAIEMLPVLTQIGESIKNMFAGDGAKAIGSFITDMENVLKAVTLIADGFKFLLATIQAVGDFAGQFAASFVTGTPANFDFGSIFGRIGSALGIGGETNPPPVLANGDSINSKNNRQTIANELTVTVAAEKGTQAKAVRGTKGSGMRLGTTMEPAF